MNYRAEKKCTLSTLPTHILGVIKFWQVLIWRSFPQNAKSPNFPAIWQFNLVLVPVPLAHSILVYF